MSMKKNSEKQDEGKLKDLIKKRKQIIEKIQKLSKRQHFLLMDKSNKKSQQAQQKIQGQPRKIVKKQQSQNNQTPLAKRRLKKEGANDEKAKALSGQGNKSESIKKEEDQNEHPKPNEKLLQRNKRLFGGLAIHLKKAQSKIQSEKPKVEEKKKVIEKVLQKQKQREEQLLREELDKSEIQIIHLQKLKEENAKQILKIQNLLLLKKYKTYANQLKTFIFTRTEPSISWQPVKEFNMAKKLLGQKQKEIDAKSEAICKSIEDYEEKFDYSQYLLDNEKEYYSGLLNEYHKTQKNFLLTKAQPPLFWKPNEMNKDLQGALNESKKQLEQNLVKGCANWDEYYSVEKNKLRSRQSLHLKEDLHSDNSGSPYPEVQKEEQQY